ncbi:MAG: threonine aldolase family protein [Tepidisphaeraceae bacterium]
MINLFSDTQTEPTPDMRRAMADAEVGDEQLGEDPTVNRLQDMTARILGKETALFVPSGTMCNAIAVKVHTQPGETIIADRLSHVLRSEFGGAAVISGATTDQISGERGIFALDQLTDTLSRFSPYTPPARLVCVEQTHNYGGGSIWPLDRLREVCNFAHGRGLTTHMDGARLFNASVATGISPAEYSSTFDSVWIDLSKGLGCPVGAVIAGSKAFIDKARRVKHLLGGAMRQAGIIAAAGVYALEHHIDRLAEDHANAKLLAEGLSHIAGIRLDNPQPETNILFFDVDPIMPASDFRARLLDLGVRMSQVARRIRAVTHMDVSRSDIERALLLIRQALERQ